MRKILTIAAGTALTLGLLAPAASASTAGVTQVITVNTVQTSVSQHGHSFSFVERLTQDGRTVGHDAVTCAFTSPSPTAVAHCIGVLIFTGSGDIFVQAIGTSGGAHGWILGGTGAFTNARGMILVENSGNGRTGEITLTFHV